MHKIVTLRDRMTFLHTVTLSLSLQCAVYRRETIARRKWIKKQLHFIVFYAVGVIFLLLLPCLAASPFFYKLYSLSSVFFSAQKKEKSTWNIHTYSLENSGISFFFFISLHRLKRYLRAPNCCYGSRSVSLRANRTKRFIEWVGLAKRKNLIMCKSVYMLRITCIYIESAPKHFSNQNGDHYFVEYERPCNVLVYAMLSAPLRTCVWATFLDALYTHESIKYLVYIQFFWVICAKQMVGLPAHNSYTCFIAFGLKYVLSILHVWLLGLLVPLFMCI